MLWVKNTFVSLSRVSMVFSKSFGYAVRGMLYVAMMQKEKRYVQVEEIASKLNVPRHFVSKILKKLVKEGLLASSKGPSGGFGLNGSSMTTPLVRIAEITEGPDFSRKCVLMMKECNSANPCPLHFQMEVVKNRMKAVLSGTSIANLLDNGKDDFIESISTSGKFENIIAEK